MKRFISIQDINSVTFDNSTLEMSRNDGASRSQFLRANRWLTLVLVKITILICIFVERMDFMTFWIFSPIFLTISWMSIFLNCFLTFVRDFLDTLDSIQSCYNSASFGLKYLWSSYVFKSDFTYNRKQNCLIIIGQKNKFRP